VSFGSLIWRNLFYNWRGNLSVLLGVVVGTAVLTGALLVGDSLRGSLRDATLNRLGWIDQALVAGRFFRQELASQPAAAHAAAAILIQGAASAHNQQSGQVTVLGVDDAFWAGAGQHAAKPSTSGLTLNGRLAHELGVAPGDEVTIHFQKVAAVPRETPLGRRDASEVLTDWQLKVQAVLPSGGLGDFTLNPSPAPPRNAFVPLALLQQRLALGKRVNTLLAAGSSANLQQSLQEHLTLDDWGLVVRGPDSRTRQLFDKLDHNHDGKLSPSEWERGLPKSLVEAVDRNHDGVLEYAEVQDYFRKNHNYLSLESHQLLVEPAVVSAALKAAGESGLRPAPTLVYLANTISDGKATNIPYSVVAALDPSLPGPLGPFLPPEVRELHDGEIILADWKESPLKARAGDTIALTYYLPEIEGRLQEQTTKFTLRGLVPLKGAADDPGLTPAFPGITDRLDIKDWDPPFPYDNKRIQPRDERYWKQYRTTPKAYISLADGQRLWGSRFGQVTSVRLAPIASERAAQADLSSLAGNFGNRLLKHLRPEQGGLAFDEIRERGLSGSLGSTDFGWLFLGFSCFLIAAALLLVGLLFRLNLDRRAGEIGVLVASGYPRRTVRALLLGEGGSLAAVGGVIGLAGAAFYAWALLRLLRAWWPGGLDESLLSLHVTWQSLALGYGLSVAVSVLTIILAARLLGRVAPRALLAGETTEASSSAPGQGGAPRWSLRASLACLVLGIILIVSGPFIPDAESQASTFFSGGALLLTAGLTACWAWMRSSRRAMVGGHGGAALARLGVRNAARHAVRSLLTAGLLAAAAFLVVSVASFYRDPGRDFLEVKGGSGGFTLLGQADVPIYQDLESRAGQDQLNFSDQTRAALQGVHFYPFRLHGGDDVSCLNLYQPHQPRLLGAAPALIERGGFRFKDSEAATPETRANPWLLLEQPREDDAIPVMGEANTVEWILHSGLGKELYVGDGNGQPVRVRVVALLQDSVFQSELLVSESNFLKLYPHHEGYQFFLIQTLPEKSAQVRQALQTALADHGFTVTPTSERVEAYLAVENTYLSTFQALGGLGLLLGALGLAVVLLRSVWERRGELALLRALGFRERALGWLVLSENSFLLVLGLAIGALSAFISVLPHLLGAGTEIPWAYLLLLLLLVLICGLSAGGLAVSRTLRAPLLDALRRE
jgi:ABC-type lipoprotein release transport system permease subunit